MKNSKKSLTGSHQHQAGGMLFELLIIVAMMASLLPMFYQQNLDRNTKKENMRIAKEVEAVSLAFDNFIQSQQKLILSVKNDQAYAVKISDIQGYGVSLTTLAPGHLYNLRVVKVADTTGKIFLQGLVSMEDETLTAFRIRAISLLLGPQGGYQDEDTLYGNYGTWNETTYHWSLPVKRNAIVLKTQSLFQHTSYIQRLPSNEEKQATMSSALSMENHNIKGVSFISTNYLTLTGALQVTDVTSSITEFVAPTVFKNVLGINGSIIVHGSASISQKISPLKPLVLTIQGSDIHPQTSVVGGLLTVATIMYSNTFSTNLLSYSVPTVAPPQGATSVPGSSSGANTSNGTPPALSLQTQTTLNVYNRLTALNLIMGSPDPSTVDPNTGLGAFPSGPAFAQVQLGYGTVITPNLMMPSAIWIDKESPNNGDPASPYAIDMGAHSVRLKSLKLDNIRFNGPLRAKMTEIENARSQRSAITSELETNDHLSSMSMNEYLSILERNYDGVFVRFCAYCQSQEGTLHVGGCQLKYGCSVP